ncbi:hypothetical protein [Amycolatopsis sp. NPDC098790]|uniref:hypothetical protein n=1 Tax=Amycolatopsis sp. NPDC098790 TaxID=3363939 RepID=UPI0037FCA27C
MSAPLRDARRAEIQRILGEQKTLLDDLLDAQQDIGRQLGCVGDHPGSVADRLGGLAQTMDRGFAEVEERIEHVVRLLQRLVEKD